MLMRRLTELNIPGTTFHYAPFPFNQVPRFACVGNTGENVNPDLRQQRIESESIISFV